MMVEFVAQVQRQKEVYLLAATRGRRVKRRKRSVVTRCIRGIVMAAIVAVVVERWRAEQGRWGAKVMRSSCRALSSCNTSDELTGERRHEFLLDFCVTG